MIASALFISTQQALTGEGRKEGKNLSGSAYQENWRYKINDQYLNGFSEKWIKITQECIKLEEGKRILKNSSIYEKCSNNNNI